MRAFLLITSLIIFSACDNQEIQKAKLLNANNPLLQKSNIKNSSTQKERILTINTQKELNLKKMELEKEEKLAKIEAQKEQKIKELELKKAKELALLKTKQKQIEANSTIELAKINSKTILEAKEKETSLYKVVAIVAFLIILIWLLIRYLQDAAKRRHEAYLREQELNYKLQLKESELKHKNISTMLEIIKDEKSDPVIKKEMAKLIAHNKNSIIEHKSK